MTKRRQDADQLVGEPTLREMDEADRDEEMVCRRLRELRQKREMTLETLADLSGFTKGYLSRIENGKKAPPIASLARLARALGEDLGYFFLEDAGSANSDESKVSVVHKWERKPVARGGTAFGYDYVSLAHKRAHKMMDPFIFTFPSETDADQYFQHSGEEFIYVMSGRVRFEIVLNGELRGWTLEAGDSMYFDSSLRHRGHSIDGAEAQALVVVQAGHDEDRAAG